MFEKNMREFMDKCHKEIEQSTNTELKKLVRKLKKQFNQEEFEKFFDYCLRVYIAKSMLESQEFCNTEEDFIAMLEMHLEMLKPMKKIMTCEIKLIGQEENVYRIMKIPYCFHLADFSYMMLAAFKAEASHLFSVYIKDEEFVCNADPNDIGYVRPYADECSFADLGLRKGSRFKVCYDFGDNYEFTIKVLNIENMDHVTCIDDCQIIDGNGYGIWEDAHYELELYYNDKTQFRKFLDSNGLLEDSFPIDEDFDLDEYNEVLINDFMLIKKAYENPEDY